MMLNVLLLLCSIQSIVSGVGLHGFTFRGLKEPEPLAKNATISEGWITQPLDHFNYRDNRTWYMRYRENSMFLKKNSSIFIMIGGEWDISDGFLQGGLMYELALNHSALMYYTEHRFYGKSRPTNDTSTENLRYLNVDQALADLAYFIETKKKEKKLEKSPVIVFGGSYAGNMAAWARLKYPHLIQGALASSAPVYAKGDFYEYYEVVTKSLGKTSAKCVEDIKTAFYSVEEFLENKINDPNMIKSIFNLCYVPDVKSLSDLGHFLNTLAEIFAETVQYDEVEENNKTSIERLCLVMTADHLGSPLQRLALLFTKDSPKCLDVNYNNFVKEYQNVSWDSSAAKTMMRQWTYQTCAEYGYYQTSSSTNSTFGTLFPLNYFITMCIDFYGDHYNKTILNSRVRRTNIMYGGRLPDLTNVIFTNGDIDPWHKLSVLDSLNTYSPAILIKGSSHCRDLYSDAPTDVPDLKEARIKIRDIIGEWVTS